MPVLDWTRTDLAWTLPGGAKALRFDAAALAAFELFALERTGHGYLPSIVDAARARWTAMTGEEKKQLQQNIIAGLPGSEEHFTIGQFQAALAAYDGIGERELRANLIAFLKEITPVAADAGLVLAIHPDDPPFPIFGLPRIVKNPSDLDALFSAVPDVANGLCFCTGSLGVKEENDLPAMVRRYQSRIHFLHLRNVQREPGGSFHEAEHLGGSTDMAAVMQAVAEMQQTRKISIPMRPDHGHQMMDDLKKKSNPGYSAIGRLKGLAELRGLEAGIMHGLSGR
jgi:mannonate dehydratase